ncbi:hypothetical protein PHYSODRAFT_301212 [Phytophthora sojae]|uniref:Uncharacterized protein n=1 Tax=Phytophthora sojae (strain P6497) TaxID=1094619 RepID=G4ZH08_PHYSP|nr:hypothetical protein PHYSODRAFT_301212 [Phytophthora sojae]EGZ18633.1 hypothetical protein PHYSODRAFT_301212 [Phytophthora sojae]|eukprot:XP_009527691.1 hypothetical protein PHYSODRAFT_301212 [Phytophthora sojae]
METLTRQQSLKAFLPSRVAALPHVVDMIDAFAMRLDEAALQAARRKNWERAGALISDMQCDILNLAGAAKDEEAETLRTIGSYISQQRLFLAVAESDDLEAAKVLYTWSERKQTPTRFVPHLLSRAATNGRVEMLEFAVEKAVERFSSELAVQGGRHYCVPALIASTASSILPEWAR